MYIMIHYNKKVAGSAMYSIEDYNQEIANKKKASKSSNLLLVAIVLFAILGLYHCIPSA